MKSYWEHYPITYNFSAMTPNKNEILIANRKNVTDFANAKYVVFPLESPTYIISTKLQMTGRRYSQRVPEYFDWALELFFYDIFGTLYEGNYKEITPHYDRFLELGEPIIIAVLYMDCF